MWEKTCISRPTKVLLITSFVLLGALLAGPLAASNSEFHVRSNSMAVLASAPFDHIVTILMENEALCSVYTGCGGSGTYESQLANQNVLVMTWGTINHNSEPNYIALFGAINDGTTSGDGVCCYFEPGQNLVDKMEGAGLTWKAFAEDAGNSGTCSFSPPRSGDHFPFIDFSDMNTASRCSHFLTTASSSDPEFLAELNSTSPANFMWLTPNDNDNGHDTGVSGADSYLAALVPKILASTEFTTTKATLLILYDEGYNQCSNTGGTGECVYASFSGPAAKKAVQISPSGASHYSYLSTIETAWGLSSINSNDAGAPNVLSAFNAACSANCPPPPLITNFNPSPASPVVNSPVTFTAVTSGGTQPYSFSWTFGDGSSAAGANVTHTYKSAQTFTVTETARDSSSPQLNTTSSNTLTVHNVSPLSTSFTVSAGPVVNVPVTFSSTTTGGIGPYSVSLSFGDGSTGSGATVTHTYSVAQAYTVTESVKDSSSPQQTTTSSLTVNVVSSLLSGDFGSCTSLPQGWSCGNTNGLSGSTSTIVNGVLDTVQVNPGVGGDNSYYYSTTQKGTFPWSPCQAPASGVLPSNLTSVSTSFSLLNFVPSGTYRYHIYLAFYYWLPNGPVTSGSSTYQCLDTQVRVENINGVFSPANTTATYNPGDSFGWDNVTLGQVQANQSYVLTASVAHQCQQDLIAWGLSPSIPCQLAGIEIGTEGYQFQQLATNWYTLQFGTSGPDFEISATSPSSVDVGPPGTTTTVTITSLNGFTGTVALTDSTTTGLSCGNISSASIVGSGTAAVACSATSAGSYPLRITGTSGSLVRSATSIFNFQDFSLSASPSSLSINKGAQGTSTISLNPLNGFGSTVALSVTSPTGITASLSTLAISGSGSSTLTVGPTMVGSYTMLVTGTSGSLTRTRTVTINVGTQPSPVLTAPPAETVVQTSTLSFTVTATDSSTSIPMLILSASGVPSDANFATVQGTSPVSGTLTWTPTTADASGTYTVGFTVTDGVASSQTYVIITVISANVLPIITVPGPQNATVGASLHFTVSATDPTGTGGPIVLSATGLASDMAFDPTSRTFSFTPSTSQAGRTFVVNFTATDSNDPSWTKTESVPIHVQGSAAQPSGGGFCLTCLLPRSITTTAWLIAIGALIGIVLSIVLLHIRATGELAAARKRAKSFKA